MKLEKNGIVAISFVVTFGILLLYSLLTSGFRPDIKGIFVAVYFAVWVAAVIFVIMTFIIPFVKERSDASKAKKAVSGTVPGAAPVPFKSPRSSLPLRERIASYVAERRREDGLPVPEPLHPSRTDSSRTGSRSTSKPRPVSAASTVAGAVAATGSVASGGEDLGDIPLPDDFGSMDESSGEMGSLPGLDEDLDDLGGFEESGGTDSGFGADASDFSDDVPDMGDATGPSPSSDGLPDGGLPGFDGDLDATFGESDLMSDDGMMDLSGDDVLTIDEDTTPPVSSSGGISDEGLPDLDGDLEPDILDSDLSGDDDFGEIEFMDLEPEEPKKKK